MLGSAFGADEDSAVIAAMEKANVVDLVDTPRPLAAIGFADETVMRRVYHSNSLRDALALCEEAVDSLVATVRHGEHIWFKCEQPCEKQHCVYCDGGLAYCVICKKGEAELEPRCPGAA